MIPLDVLNAFGLPHVFTPLIGGQGASWRVGDFVLKPHEASYEGISQMVDQLKPEGFRVSYHHPTLLGNYTYKGWGCTRFEPGKEVTGRIEEKYAVALALHDLFANIEKPTDWHPSVSPWSLAHEVAWGEANLPEMIHPEIRRIIQTANKEVSPLLLKNQIIHGDLCGNILFHETLSPLVIDFSLDYRPRQYAEAILIADAIAWEGGGETALKLLPETELSRQVLLRACVFRLATKAFLKPDDLQSFLVKSQGYRDLLKKLIS